MIPSLFTQLKTFHKHASKSKVRKKPSPGKKQEKGNDRKIRCISTMIAGKTYTTNEVGRMIGVTNKNWQAKAVRKLESANLVENCGTAITDAGSKTLLWRKCAPINAVES